MDGDIKANKTRTKIAAKPTNRDQIDRRQITPGSGALPEWRTRRQSLSTAFDLRLVDAAGIREAKARGSVVIESEQGRMDLMFLPSRRRACCRDGLLDWCRSWSDLSTDHYTR